MLQLRWLLLLLVLLTAPLLADGQTGGGGRMERVQVIFTPTICKVRCSQDGCVNSCEKGNVTTLYSSGEEGGGRGGGGGHDGPHGPGFRVFLCPLLCKNGGICLQRDRCLCPANFTGKFCHIPATHPTPGVAAASSTNDIVQPTLFSTNQELTRSEFRLSMGRSQEAGRPGAPGPPVVTVRVQHPPEAGVKIHQVTKVSGSGPVLRTLSSSSGSAGAPAPSAARAVVPSGVGVQAQTVRGSGTYTQQSGFRYCFREVKDGQCSAPLPGLRSVDTCCRGLGRAWGLSDCVLCPGGSGDHVTSSSSSPSPGRGNSSCPVGFEQVNGTQCVDVDECLQPGLCENGLCVNTRGSYSCVCRLGFILDATHGLCISHSVMSEEKGQCYRVLGPGPGPGPGPSAGPVPGPSSCSMPILRNITKQICCCSRVGKAWGADCQRCPYFGSAAFREICPAGPGYYYTASTLQFSQRVADELQNRVLLTAEDGPAPPSGSGGTRSKPSGPSSSGAGTRIGPAQRGPLPQPLPTAGPVRPDSSGTGTAPQGRAGSVQPRPPSTGSRGAAPDQPAARGDSLPAPARAPDPDRGSRPGRPAVGPTAQPARVPSRTHTADSTVRGVCDSRPDVCGRGHCVDQPGGTHTCVCDPGFQVNSQRSHCSDIDECQQSPCSNGRCENTPGSYRCVCHHGYRLHGNTCSDVDECADPLRCPGQECVNTPGSYRCTSCQPGFGLLNGVCTDIDECRRSACSNGRCQNTPGSYRCLCHHGYRLQNHTCTDVDECAEPSQCPGQMCVNSQGSYRCVSCRPGYRLTNRQCTDVDECAAAGVCEAAQVCVNAVGSFRCECVPGYRSAGPGRPCRDLDECSDGTACSGGGCVNTPGSYRCVCAAGFTPGANGTSCLDVDECVRAAVCSGGRCVNAVGSFRCECGAGFSAGPAETACLDVDECAAPGSVCGSRPCQNTVGSYRCLAACQPGHRAAPGGGCEDVDECATLPGLCGSGRCHNTDGSFTCTCDGTGQVFNSRTRTCIATRTNSQLGLHRTSSSTSFPRSPSPSSPSGSAPVSAAPPPPALPGELRDCYYALGGGCSLLASNTSRQECCCTLGEGWGRGCRYHACPPPDSREFLSLCPSGRGYVTEGPGTFSYRDVDECKRFQPQVCKNGVCVNNIPGYSCYCSIGFVYDSAQLECVDHDECEEESCVGGACINTLGSYHCSCAPPLVLDDTQRNCINASYPPFDENLSVCWQHVSADLLCQSPLLGAQLTFIDCCCLFGEGWGMGCALCPASDSDDYAHLCSSYPLVPDSFPDPTGSDAGLRPGAGRGAPPFGPDRFPPALVPSRDFSRPDYDDYAPDWSDRAGSRGRAPASFSPDYSARLYPGGDYTSLDSSRTPPFLLDPRSNIDARPLPASRPELPPLSRTPLARPPYEEEEERAWMPGPAFPGFTDRSRGGGAPRRAYERHYDSHAGLSTAEDCGILHGCENGRCIRVAEGYTCDCYQGYELDMTSMTCTDLNECEDAVGVEFPCVNARCVNTEGSFRCVCRRGYVMSRRLNHCVAA